MNIQYIKREIIIPLIFPNFQCVFLFFPIFFYFFAYFIIFLGIKLIN